MSDYTSCFLLPAYVFASNYEDDETEHYEDLMGTDLQIPKSYMIPPCKAGPERFVPTAALNDINYEMHQCNISTWPPASVDDSESSDSDSDARPPTDEHQHLRADLVMDASPEVTEVIDDQMSTLNKSINNEDHEDTSDDNDTTSRTSTPEVPEIPDETSQGSNGDSNSTDGSEASSSPFEFSITPATPSTSSEDGLSALLLDVSPDTCFTRRLLMTPILSDAEYLKIPNNHITNDGRKEMRQRKHLPPTDLENISSILSDLFSPVTINKPRVHPFAERWVSSGGSYRRGSVMVNIDAPPPLGVIAEEESSSDESEDEAEGITAHVILPPTQPLRINTRGVERERFPAKKCDRRRVVVNITDHLQTRKILREIEEEAEEIERVVESKEELFEGRQEEFEDISLVDDSPVPPTDLIESKTKEGTIREFIIGPLPSKEELESPLTVLEPSTIQARVFFSKKSEDRILNTVKDHSKVSQKPSPNGRRSFKSVLQKWLPRKKSDSLSNSTNGSSKVPKKEQGEGVLVERLAELAAIRRKLFATQASAVCMDEAHIGTPKPHPHYTIHRSIAEPFQVPALDNVRPPPVPTCRPESVDLDDFLPLSLIASRPPPILSALAPFTCRVETFSPANSSARSFIMMARPPIIIVTPPPEDGALSPPASPHMDLAPMPDPSVSGHIDASIEPLPPACLKESASVELPSLPPSTTAASPSGDSLLVSPLPAIPEEELSALKEETSIDLEEPPAAASSTPPLLPLPLPPLVPPSPPLSEKIKTPKLVHVAGVVKDRTITPTTLASGFLSAHRSRPNASSTTRSRVNSIVAQGNQPTGGKRLHPSRRPCPIIRSLPPPAPEPRPSFMSPTRSSVHRAGLQH